MKSDVKPLCTMEEMRARLQEMAEEKYRAFASSLLPGVNNLLGVRLPLLRRMAKDIAGTPFAQHVIAHKERHSFEETMLQGFVIAALPISFEERWTHAARFVETIDNWSVCDSFCISLKDTRENRARAFSLLAPYLQSEKEFAARFGAVMLLNHFVCDDYRDAALDALSGIPARGYYARMAVAWAVQTFYASYPETVQAFLDAQRLDAETTALAYRKIAESRRTAPGRKKKTQNNDAAGKPERCLTDKTFIRPADKETGVETIG